MSDTKFTEARPQEVDIAQDALTIALRSEHESETLTLTIEAGVQLANALIQMSISAHQQMASEKLKSAEIEGYGYVTPVRVGRVDVGPDAVGREIYVWFDKDKTYGLAWSLALDKVDAFVAMLREAQVVAARRAEGHE